MPTMAEVAQRLERFQTGAVFRIDPPSRPGQYADDIVGAIVLLTCNRSFVVIEPGPARRPQRGDGWSAPVGSCEINVSPVMMRPAGGTG